MGSSFLFSRSSSLRIPEEDLWPDSNDKDGKAPFLEEPPPLPRETVHHRRLHPVVKPSKKGRQKSGQKGRGKKRREHEKGKQRKGSSLTKKLEAIEEEEVELGAGSETADKSEP